MACRPHGGSPFPVDASNVATSSKTPAALCSRWSIRRTGAHAPVFFRLRRTATDISRYGKIFCVVKNRAAGHNGPCCSMGKIVSLCEIKNVSI
ncbi:hypothetical protein EN871_22560 [bacterium M00.F.Ca.ET.228.01.1.1]|nr:hypothetical protein EN871_22560 [bacterium M00.F.Ca.ET.228.01.1.1]TGR98553.1 hypothetical protein EN834_22175 [bacterium M00.F.Ca.ET.191.01.1.1]TGU02888.1 hypothetical protein EN798_22995 [bacterium M00.F.Ca.ET.155.01.1.1]